MSSSLCIAKDGGRRCRVHLIVLAPIAVVMEIAVGSGLVLRGLEKISRYDPFRLQSLELAAFPLSPSSGFLLRHRTFPNFH